MSTAVPTWIADFDSIRRDLTDLGTKQLIHRAHIRELQEVDVRDGTGIVHRWMQENYADSMLIGLRRVLDDDRKTFSLIRLLRKVQRHHSDFTLERYLQLWRLSALPVDERFAQMLYLRFSLDGRTLDRGRVHADIRRLLDDHKSVLSYINTTVAHRSAGETDSITPTTAISWEDLDRLFDDVASVFNKYYDLVRPGVHVDFSPVLPAGYARAFKRLVRGEQEQP